MATDASGRFGRCQTAAGSFDDGLRFGAEVSYGDVERRQRVVETDAALVHRPVVLEHVRLAGLSLAECPQDWNRKGLSPTGHGNEAAIALPLNQGVVGAFLKLEIGMFLEDFAEFHRLGGLRHRGGVKMRRLLSVTGGASGIARSRCGKERQE